MGGGGWMGGQISQGLAKIFKFAKVFWKFH